MEKKLQKIHLTYYSLFKAQGIHKFKCKYRHHMKLAELNISIATVFLNIKLLKML